MSATNGGVVAETALGVARRAANARRLSRWPAPDNYLFGIAVGQLIIARVWFDADPVAIQAATNEIEFLQYAYLKGTA